MIKKRTTRGQTALIMIVLSAAALIFLAGTLNWGRVAQVKTLLTVAADQGAALLASDVASYGEMEKQTYLQNSNQISSLGGVFMAFIGIIVAIICLIITITSAGAGSGVWAAFTIVLACASVVMAVINFVLQICVIQPGIESLWNSLQKKQTIQQQFFEGGVTTSLQGSVTDQVSITDYFDLNTNGKYGSVNGFPVDTVSRFAVFYTDRLRMLNQSLIPEVVFFYQQLGEFMNGETCSQNESDFSLHPGISINPYCLTLGDSTYCTSNATDTDPACQMTIPNSFQLNDPCTDSNPASSTYNPYCDPCCQPLSIANPYYSSKTPPPAQIPSQPANIRIRPLSCASPSSTSCDPSNPNDPACVPPNNECVTNNPYGAAYPYIYDSTFQEYQNGLSFLDQFGRDQQLMPLTGTVPPTIMTPQGDSGDGVTFPNGIYPYFWLMKDYSPEVDNITPAGLTSQSIHWCSSANVTSNGVSIAAFTGPTGFVDLAQLNLTNSSGYSCRAKTVVLIISLMALVLASVPQNQTRCK